VTAKVTPERLAERELKQAQRELEAQFPGDDDRVAREVERYRERQERQAERDRLTDEEQQVWAEIGEQERDGWVSLFMDLAIAKREAARSRRQRGAGLTNHRPSIAAPLRARPRGGP